MTDTSQTFTVMSQRVGQNGLIAQAVHNVAMSVNLHINMIIKSHPQMGKIYGIFV